MIDIEGLSFSIRGDRLLNGSFCLPEGSFTAMIGPSGAGKTTTLNIIAGFINSAINKLILAGEDVAKTPARDRPLSFLFQNYNLFPHLSVEENIGLAINSRLKFSGSEKNLISEVLHKVGLDGYQDSYPDSLSFGEQQRVALSRILLRKKPVLLLDEPFSACDPGSRKNLLNLILEIHKENNLTTIMTTHYPDEAKDQADYLLFIDSTGKIHEPQIPEKLLSSDIKEFKKFMYG